MLRTLALASLLASACFDPKFAAGAGNFQCRMGGDASPAEAECPDGFRCDSAAQRCVPIARDAGTGDPCDHPAFPGAPSIRIDEPRDGSCILVNMPVTVTVSIDNFALDAGLAHVGERPIPGCGHWHLQINGVYTREPHDRLLVEEDGRFFPTEGAYTLRASLHDNMHNDLSPPVTATITLCAGGPPACVNGMCGPVTTQ